jgi:Flp pilus assembly protein TadD
VTLSGRSPSTLGTLAETYGLAGRKEEARKLLNEMAALSHKRYVPAMALVLANIGLGDKEQIFTWLERAYQQREQGIAWLAVEDHAPTVRIRGSGNCCVAWVFRTTEELAGF